MFYEESAIRKLLKCQQCLYNYDEHDQPCTLPCGKNICNNCVAKIESLAKTSKKFKCTLCAEEHAIPEKGSFPVNETLLELLKTQPKEVFRSKECSELKENLRNLETLLKSLKFEYSIGVERIKSYCAEQRNQIQVSTAKRIKEINHLNTVLMEEIDSYEKECIDWYSNNEAFKKYMHDQIDNVLKFIAEKEKYLKEYEIDEEIIRKSNQLSQNVKSHLDFELKKLKITVFGNEIIKFNANSIKLDALVLGRIDYERLDSNKLKVISGSFDHSIHIWDLDSGKKIKTFQGHTDGILCLNLVNNKLISGSDDRTIKIWNFETGECSKTLNVHTDRVRSIQVITDDLIISCSNDTTVKLLDITSGQCIKKFEGHIAPVYCMEKISSEKFATGSSDTSIFIWDLKFTKPIKVIRGHSEFVCCLKTLPEHNMLLSGSGDKTIIGWDLTAYNIVRRFEGHTDAVRCILKMPNDFLISGSADKTIKIWNFTQANCLQTIRAHSMEVWHLGMLSNNKFISASADKTLKVWSVRSGFCLKTIEAHSADVWCLHVFK